MFPASHHAGGRSEPLIQPSTISDFSGSGRSQFGHCMSAGALPSGDGTRTILRPHLGQFASAIAKEIPLPWHILYRPAHDGHCRGRHRIEAQALSSDLAGAWATGMDTSTLAVKMHRQARAMASYNMSIMWGAKLVGVTASSLRQLTAAT